jgi:hypothetical protein
MICLVPIVSSDQKFNVGTLGETLDLSGSKGFKSLMQVKWAEPVDLPGANGFEK